MRDFIEKVYAYYCQVIGSRDLTNEEQRFFNHCLDNEELIADPNTKDNNVNIVVAYWYYQDINAKPEYNRIKDLTLNQIYHTLYEY